MADRGKDFGDMRGIRARLAARYSSEKEAEVRGWVKELTGEDIGEGAFNVERALKDGQILLKLMSEVLSRTSNVPAKCQSIPLKPHTMNVEFKHMENINNFLNAAEAYGVNRGLLFQTPDLYEGRNMAQVISTIIFLGTEAKRNGMNGPTIGPNPTTANYRHFDEKVLQNGKAIIGLQAGTNKCASQKGMVMGSVRHVSDIRITEIDREQYGAWEKSTAKTANVDNGYDGYDEPVQAEEVQAEESAPVESAPEESAPVESTPDESAPAENDWQGESDFTAETVNATEDVQASFGDDTAASFEGETSEATFGGDSAEAEASFVADAEATFDAPDGGEETSWSKKEPEAEADVSWNNDGAEATFHSGDVENTSATINYD